MLLTKVYNVWTKKELSFMTLESDAKFDEELTCQFKIDMRKFKEFWHEHSKILRICTLMGCLWPKCIMFELIKYRGIVFDDTKYWCKIWSKTDLCFQKWHDEFQKFSPEHSKVSKLGLWWDPLIQSRKSMSLKFTENLYIITIKNNTKFEEELTCQFKIETRNLANFCRSTWKSKTFAL